MRRHCFSKSPLLLVLKCVEPTIISKKRDRREDSGKADGRSQSIIRYCNLRAIKT